MSEAPKKLLNEQVEDIMAMVREYGALRIDHDRSRTTRNAHACDDAFAAIQSRLEHLLALSQQHKPK